MISIFFSLTVSLCWPTNCGECLGDDKDVVNSNAEENEGDHCVGCGVEQAEQGAESVAQDHPHGHTESSSWLILLIINDLIFTWVFQLLTTKIFAGPNSSCWASRSHKWRLERSLRQAYQRPAKKQSFGII